jgi:hypothetical protein
MKELSAKEDPPEVLAYIQLYSDNKYYTGVVFFEDSDEWKVCLNSLSMDLDIGPILGIGEGSSYWIARDAAILSSSLSEREWMLFPALDDLVARSVIERVRKLQGDPDV